RRIGAGDVRLRHREERTRVALDEGPEPAFPLLVGTEQVQDLTVPGVGCLAVEHVLRPGHAADLLVQVGVAEEAFASAAGLGRQVRRPQAGRSRAGAQVAQQAVGLVVLAKQVLLDRQDVLLDERAVGRPRLSHYTRSTIIAMPWPPPTHIVSRPIVLSPAWRSFRSVAMIRAPVMPYGWPSAIAPPCGLSLSLKGSIPSSRHTGSTCAANASFSSTTSTSSIVMPACLRTVRTAPIG